MIGDGQPEAEATDARVEADALIAPNSVACASG